MESPRVTVIVPCHNHEKWVEGALDSIAKQDYENKQILVVENGSKDNSPKIIYDLVNRKQYTNTPFTLGKYKDTDIDIAFSCCGEAMGPSWARNQGIKFAAPFTNLYAFLDSDDIYEPTKLSKSVKIWEEYPKSIGIVYSDYDTVGEDCVRIREYKEPFSRARLIQDCIINCDSLISKDVFEKVGLFDETLRVCEDYDMWIRASEQFLCCHIPESLVTIRIGSHSSTANVDPKTWNACRKRVFDKMIERSGS